MWSRWGWMCRRKHFVNSDQKGMTFIEVLLSITILSIVIMAFLTFFIQSSKTNEQSSDILDATYLTQTYMETFYMRSTENSFDMFIAELKEQDHFQEHVAAEAGYVELSKLDQGYFIVLKIKEPRDGISPLMIRTYKDASQSQLMAKMESRIQWKQ